MRFRTGESQYSFHYTVVFLRSKCRSTNHFPALTFRLTHCKQLVFLLFIGIFPVYNNELTGVSSWKHAFSWKINVCKCRKMQWFHVCCSYNAYKMSCFLLFRTIFRTINEMFTRVFQSKACISNISSQWWIRANSIKRIFRRFTVYNCSFNPWKITVILLFTTVLRIPTWYSLELTSRNMHFPVFSLQRCIRINSCKACIFSRLPPLG